MSEKLTALALQIPDDMDLGDIEVSEDYNYIFTKFI